MTPTRTLALTGLLVLAACSPPEGRSGGATREGGPSGVEHGTPAERGTPAEPETGQAVARFVRAAVGAAGGGPTAHLPDGPDPRADTFYTARGGSPVWLEDRRRRDLLEALRGLPQEGLEVPGADPARLDRIGSDLEAGDPRARAEAELLLTETFLAAATALLRGAHDPRASGLDWRLSRDPPPGAGILRRVAGGAEPSDVLGSLRPAVPHYARLVEALGRYRKIASRGGWPDVQDGRVVEPGDTARLIALVRKRMVAGADSTERRLARTGEGRPEVLDPSLSSAVRHFQRRHGLAVDGVVGPETVEALNVPAGRRARTLEANLARLRWMPRDLGERSVLVNVAGFELVALERNQPVLSMDVVVGRPEWRTRIFADSMTHLVVNPYWHVPESIETREILPAVLEDPSYLRRHRLDVVPQDEPFGEPVDPSAVDWPRTADGGFPWDFRQRPGRANSLGRIKFIFPNPFAVYLHDTPADRLFDRSLRAFSHGCIRVERPWELARWVVEWAVDGPAPDVTRLRDAGERARIDLDRSVPVYIVYLTAWVDDQGVVSFHPDIYRRDAALEPVVGRS